MTFGFLAGLLANGGEPLLPEIRIDRISGLGGHVVSATGEPVGGVEISWDSGDHKAYTHTDEEGFFHFLDPAGCEGTIFVNGGTGVSRFEIDKAKVNGGYLSLTYPTLMREVVILHDNDQHFHFNFTEEVAEVAAFIRASRTNVVHLNGGDIFVRHRHRWAVDSIAYYEDKASEMIDKMNLIGYEAMVLGNHEIDYHEYATRRQLERAQFALLGANVASSTPNMLTPEPYLKLALPNQVRLTVLGLSVGNASGVSVSPRDVTMRQYLHLRDEADLLVLLTHVGLGNDRNLANSFPQVDVIIGGHSHSLLNPAETVNGVLVAQAGGHPHRDGGFIDPSRPDYLGVIQILLQDDRVVQKRGRVFTIDANTYLQDAENILSWLDEETKVTMPNAGTLHVIPPPVR